MGNRADLKAYADANFDANGIGGITGPELNAYANSIADLALIIGEAGDLGVALEWASGLLGVKASGITATEIAANAVVTSKILDNNVTLAKLATIADATFLGNNSGGAHIPIALTVAQTKTLLAIAVADVSGAEATANKDTDGTLSANSDTKYPSQKAVKTYVDQIIAAQDAMVFKGVIDASANPNYPAADRGWTYRISVAGKIGGSSGTNVEVGDILICLTDGTASGNQATVGTAWNITQTNIDGAVVGPTSVTDGNPVLFDGTSGKLLKQSTFSAFKTSLAIAYADVSGLGTAATKNYGTSGDTIPKNDTGNTFSVQQTVSLNSTTIPIVSESTESSTPSSLAGGFIATRSVNGAANMYIGGLTMMSKSASGTFRSYARIYAQIITATNAAENGVIIADTIRAGTVSNEFTLGGGMVFGAPTGGAKGIGTVNAQTLYNNGSALGTTAITAPDGSTLEISGTTLRVKDAGIVYAKIQTIAAVSVMGRSAGTGGVGADIQAANDGDVLRRSGSTLGFGTVTTAGIADNQVTLAKMFNLSQSTIIGRAAAAGTGVPTALTGAQVKTILAIAQADVSGLTTADSPSFAGLTLTNNNSLIVGTGSWIVPGYGAKLSAQNGTYTFVLGDAGTVVRHNSTSAHTYTIPPNSSVAFPLGTRIDVVNINSGNYTIARGAGVTMYVSGTNTNFTSTLTWSTIIKVDTDVWMFREI